MSGHRNDRKLLKTDVSRVWVTIVSESQGTDVTLLPLELSRNRDRQKMVASSFLRVLLTDKPVGSYST